ncbi:hypothetical protein ACFST9_18380 [Hymenobacter monticola]|uniref:SMP-30/Gluconolactonase/LRE-like region domain-containing protein n=1 Tax=Hymenobacter monticola TaxID=1705399 RepID=A0ABY4AZ06_9BACT|nr:hypothetical protein [Hymenobacter monticola]UOE32121.1 hypothetical protein MTP16_13385 [Hymenobacter monticola]
MLHLLRDALFPVLVFLHAVLVGAPANHGRGRFQRARYQVRKVGRLPRSVRESSGLARADTLGTFWTHGDGGSPAHLTEFALPGAVRRQLDLSPLPNKDWEDLARDPTGRLYIGDFGNNRSQRSDLAIYRLDWSGGRPVVDTIAFHYADQTAFPPRRGRRNFDCEAFYFYQDTLHLFSKDRSLRQLTKHYVLPARPGHHVAVLRDSLRLGRPITAADVSPDGRTVALLGYGGVFFFANAPGCRLFDGPKRFRALPRTGQAEGLAFLTDSTLLVGNEKGRLWRLRPRARSAN